MNDFIDRDPEPSASPPTLDKFIRRLPQPLRLLGWIIYVSLIFFAVLGGFALLLKIILIVVGAI